MSVGVVPYNPEWKDWFNEICEPIWEKMEEYVVDIVHVGSTSVEGMSAKPVIDIDIVVNGWENFPEITEQLGELGYQHIGDLGINEREAFNYKSANHRHNLYVCHKDSIAYRNHVLLKKHLTENPKDFRRYKELKLKLSQTSENVDEYCRAKTDLILEFLKAEGIPEKDLDEIRSSNLN